MNQHLFGTAASRDGFLRPASAPPVRLSYHLVAMSAALFLLLDPLSLLAAAWLALPMQAGSAGLRADLGAAALTAALVAAVLALFILDDPRFDGGASSGRSAPVLGAHALRFALFVLLLLGLVAASGVLETLPWAWLLSWLAGSLLLTSLSRVLVARGLQRLQRAGRLTEVIAVVGAGQAAQRLVHALRRDSAHSIELLGVFDDGFEGALPSEARARGTVPDLVALGQSRKIDWIVLALPAQAEYRLPQVLKQLKALSVPIGLCPRRLAADLVRPGVAYVGDHVPVGLLAQPAAGGLDGMVQAGESMAPRWIVTLVLLALAVVGASLRRAAAFFRVATPQPKSARCISLDGYDLASFTERAACFGRHDFGYVVTPNADHLIRLHDDAAFRASYAAAAFVLLDSRFVARLLRVTRGLVLPVCPGSDLTAALLREVITPDDRIVLVGGTEAQAQQLRQRHGLRQLVQFVPRMGFIHDPAAVQVCLRFVEAHSPFRFCLLAVGSPQQEVLAQALRERGRARGLALCIGASINFITGEERRAPGWMQQLGIEWLYRLVQDPVRMAHRYLVRGPRVFGVLRGSEVVLRPPGRMPAQRVDQRGSSRPFSSNR
ncbi:WecB/TagA/CpsF family glycosyltransferase [uncultured Piscinibacter sp.]|uniref:WecB/TagA/CpsF family glycosyltransferase n=1 Tax=uncultured Piscinibacter sp. TaxID=1131835 RepID=UPI002621C449|nr:WecB/TagA/CpsF family glycosyltransferase [uncultured Piscinibacter sp.]